MTNEELFIEAVNFVLSAEGYKSEDPDDAGGRTIFGISENSHPTQVKEMWDLPKEEARKKAIEIYRTEYWNKVVMVYSGGQAFFMFDTCVNLGLGYIKKMMGMSLMEMIIERVRDYADIARSGSNIKFLRGWILRTVNCADKAKLIK